MALDRVFGPVSWEPPTLLNDMVGMTTGSSSHGDTNAAATAVQFSDVAPAGPSIWSDQHGVLVVSFWSVSGGGSHAGTYQGLCIVRPDGELLMVSRNHQGTPAGPIGFGSVAETGEISAMWTDATYGGPRWALLEPLMGSERDTYRPCGRGCISTGFGVLPDRLITAFDFEGDEVPRIYTAPLSDAGTDPWDVEYTFASPIGDWVEPWLVYAGRDASNGHHLWWVADSYTGLLMQYDSTAQEEVGVRSSFGSDGDFFHSIAYSTKHRLFYLLQWGSAGFKRLQVFSTEVAATDIADPTLAGTLVRGGRVLASTTVTGSDGEPCPGRNILFETTVGSMVAAVVETDADGVATAVLQAPDATSTGNTLTVTLLE